LIGIDFFFRVFGLPTGSRALRRDVGGATSSFIGSTHAGDIRGGERVAGSPQRYNRWCRRWILVAGHDSPPLQGSRRRLEQIS
jgi:hypothetical protein